MQLHSGVGILQAKFSSCNETVRITNCSWAVAPVPKRLNVGTHRFDKVGRRLLA